jgi:hypothetical protein
MADPQIPQIPQILIDCKTALRISSATTAYDTEVTDLISSAKADLALSGVLVTSDTDALVKRAILTYVKANFGWNNPDAEKLQSSYEMLKQHLTLSTDYAYYAITFTVKDSVTLAAIREAEVTFNDETKETNASGIAIFYVRTGDNYEYMVTADDYESDEHEDDDPNLIDVTADMAVAISLVAI